ncbi:YpfB family protein [Neobacillus sp. LXY-1]|uniref:YpfB family protein n=1 Tax=Neobacillus sp. LXY-1 TaxID=3379133 RepID=UPI003EE2084D
MKKAEAILIKVILVQFLFLFLSQFIFHQLDVMPELKQITKYEGVSKTKFTDILQTLKGK